MRFHIIIPSLSSLFTQKSWLYLNPGFGEIIVPPASWDHRTYFHTISHSSFERQVAIGSWLWILCTWVWLLWWLSLFEHSLTSPSHPCHLHSVPNCLERVKSRSNIKICKLIVFVVNFTTIVIVNDVPYLFAISFNYPVMSIKWKLISVTSTRLTLVIFSVN